MAYFIIETEKQLNSLPVVEECFIKVIPFSDEVHPKLTEVSLIYYNDFSKGYIFCIKHLEGFSLDIELIKKRLKLSSTVYVTDQKYTSYFLDLENLYDVNQHLLDIDNKLKDFTFQTPVYRDFTYKFKNSNKCNLLIPVSKHYEQSEFLFGTLVPLIDRKCLRSPYIAYTEVYKWVEEQGIRIDNKLFEKHFKTNTDSRSISGDIIYTSYNLYNITSRPTNSFNGINFLALNKDNNCRSAFIPKNDIFIEFDFDAYHLRLIANKLNINLPFSESIHEYLGKQYFNKSKLTDQEYAECKKITFRQLYNGVEKKYKKIEFFEKINMFIQYLWGTFKERGYIKLPNGRKLKDNNEFNPTKLFNYYVQCLETVNNINKLVKLKELLKDKESKPVLIVYDSILIDYSKKDGKEVLFKIQDILQEGNYVVKIKSGLNYNFS